MATEKYIFQCEYCGRKRTSEAELPEGWYFIDLIYRHRNSKTYAKRKYGFICSQVCLKLILGFDSRKNHKNHLNLKKGIESKREEVFRNE